MTNANLESAAQFLLAARERGTPGPRIPVEFRPENVDDGLAIQARTTALLGQPVGGYKCALPTELRPVLVAPIFEPAITYSSPCPVIAPGTSVRVEPEIAFVMARDLPPRAAGYAESEVRVAVKEVHLALEILGSRYSEPHSASFPELLADGLVNQGLLVGPVLRDPWDRQLETLPIVIDCAADTLAIHEGRHPDGHPLRPLHWLANYLACRGSPLRAGMVVTTGSYCGAVEVPVNARLAFKFGDLGTLLATLNRA